MRSQIVSISVAMLLTLGGMSRVQAETSLSNAEIGEWLMEQAVAEILPYLNQAGREVALKSVSLTPEAENLFLEELARYLYERGYEVWLLDDEAASPPSTAALVEVEVIAAKIFYPRTRRSFLSIGQPSIARRGTLALDVRVLGAGGGPWLYDGRPEARFEDWLEAKDVAGLAEDQPTWIELEEQPGAAGPERPAGWTERFVVASLLSGVIILYFSGAQ